MDRLERAKRIARTQKQMQERSGPIYETAKERSRIISEAWRAAGSPRHVSMLHTPEGVKYGVRLKPGLFEWVSRAEWEKWCAWRNERARLHKEYGWKK